MDSESTATRRSAIRSTTSISATAALAGICATAAAGCGQVDEFDRTARIESSSDNNPSEWETCHRTRAATYKTMRSTDGGYEEVRTEVETYTYDDEGRRTRRRSYFPGTDGPDPEWVRTHDYEGDRRVRTTYYAGPVSNGRRTDVVLRDYEDGRLAREETYARGEVDGEPESVTTYVYGDDGRLLRREKDDDPDGERDRTWLHSYDDRGLRTRTEIYTGPDFDTDDTPMRSFTYEYDSEGRLVREALDEARSHETEKVWTYEYDADGNRVRQTYNVHGGVEDMVTHYTYRCP